MADSVTGTLRVWIDITTERALDLTTTKDALAYHHTDTLTDGDGADEANRCWHDSRTLAGGANETIDITDPGDDALGRTLTLTRIVALIIQNTGTVSIKLEPGASDGWTGAFADDITPIVAGGTVAFIAPSTAGYAVAAGNKNIKITNLDGADGAAYDIIILGSQ